MTDCEMYIRNNSSTQSYSDQSLLNQLEITLHMLEQGIQLLSQAGFEDEHSLLSRFYSNISRYIRTLQYGFNDCTVPPVYVSSYTLLHTGLAGRPKISLNIDTVELLRSCGYDWGQIADALQISRTTLWRRVKEAGCLIQKYSEISDDELDSVMSQIQREHPNCGQQLLCGFLKDKGVFVQRYRLRESIARTDPIRRHVRWHQVVSRRTILSREAIVCGT